MKSPVLKIVGMASKKIVKEIPLTTENKFKSLLNIVRDAGIGIAYSCDGEGVCRTCVINDEVLSCLTYLNDIDEDEEGNFTIYIGYL